MELKRRPTALSYSSYSLFVKNPDEFYMRYLAGSKAPRIPQEAPMGVGSAFDAFVKAELHSAVFGPNSDPDFEFNKLFEDQVEPHNRDFCKAAGEHALAAYKHTGAYQELLDLLLKSTEPPRFETKLDAVIEGVPISGKPDLRFMLKPRDREIRVILDWKVRGYCSKSTTSPSKGYALCRDGYVSAKPTKSHGKEHSNYLAYDHHGLTINQAMMEACNEDYADQVSIYGWMLGIVPGDESAVVAIDEIVAKPATPPELRVANHRARVGKEHQLKLLEGLKRCWNAIQTGHVFLDMSREDNDGRCEVLENVTIGLATDGSPEEQWYNDATRTTRF